MDTLALKAKIFNLGLDVTDLKTKGYQFLPGAEWPIPASIARCWNSLAHSWCDLPVDRYLKNGATFRQRRFGRFVYREINGHMTPISGTRFFQSKENNIYAGGFERTFAPLHEMSYHNKLLHYIITNSLDHFCSAFAAHQECWDISLHQFRIIAHGENMGMPTPEGIHRDGHKFISIHLISRNNVKGGVSSIYDNDDQKLLEITLEQPLDSLFVADEWRQHGVTPIRAEDPSMSAHRDVLVIDYNFSQG